MHNFVFMHMIYIILIKFDLERYSKLYLARHYNSSSSSESSLPSLLSELIATNDSSSPLRSAFVFGDAPSLRRSCLARLENLCSIDTSNSPTRTLEVRAVAIESNELDLLPLSTIHEYRKSRIPGLIAEDSTMDLGIVYQSPSVGQYKGFSLKKDT